jgi:hypothetical protein
MMLPFSSEKNREPFGDEVELASVFAIAEFERSKGKGIVIRQPNEKLHFIAQLAYPLWLYPKNEIAYILDALNPTRGTTLPVPQLPSAETFLETLGNQSKTRQDYTAFLLDHTSYFDQPKKEKQIQLKGLIADEEFKKEFALYRKEALEPTQQNQGLLTPNLGESEISASLNELETLLNGIREDADKLSECLRQINRLTSQYVTELDYAAQAAKDEATAKIKAQEEVINPQITRLNSDYKKRITSVAKGYDDEIESFEKQKAKTKKAIESGEEKIEHYQREAQSRVRKNHLAYEERWKNKVSKTKKEVEGLKKQFNKLEKSSSSLAKQKTDEVNRLEIKLEAEIKVIRQPLLDLRAVLEAKLFVFKQQIDQLVKLEKTVTAEVYRAIRERETLNSVFENLGMKDLSLKIPILFYVPFYVVCYSAGLSRRYLFLPPSKNNAIGLSGKLKGAFGMSKIKEKFTQRFKAITGLIERCQVLIRQDSAFETEIDVFGEKNNFLNKTSGLENISKGLVYLQHEGTLSDKEGQALNSSLKS